jgi:hypothetical protein
MTIVVGRGVATWNMAVAFDGHDGVGAIAAVDGVGG